ncbi:N-acyltransferase YncA [Rubripirellula tenax]|uniref:N-acyltransferase YncA n=1 Tax=Rubripirellula tenax TaxID=2528015 RepID=A0A5C6EEN3_9BACT|nr:GNAT family N-acetyltransferase [Rubripirellula tenax]TWU47482.1 N-acyltransferase YncA [Rubripirellula tenax]
MGDALTDDSLSDPRCQEARTTDAEKIAEIYNHYVRVGGATFDLATWTAIQVRELLQIKPPEVWVICSSDDDMLGWASARQFSTRHGFRMSLESAIYMAPEAMGRGIADLLQQDVERRCRAANIHHLMARIISTNQRSIAFHRRHGYELVGIQKEVGHMDDRWIDLAIMQKILTPAS